MNEITSIMPQVKDKTRCNVYVDGRFCCGMTLETVVKYRLKVGQNISAERLAEIQLESERNTAFDKALTHLSATRKTERQIRTFLSGKGYLAAVIDHVIDKLRSYNFLNDEEYAENYVEFASRKKGCRLIKMELRGKGLSEEAIEGALSGLDSESELQTAKEILQKYMRGKTVDTATMQKACKYLIGKGFAYDIAKEALSEFGDTEDFPAD